MNAFPGGLDEGVVTEDRRELSNDDSGRGGLRLVAELAAERPGLGHASMRVPRIATKLMSCWRFVFAVSIPSLIVWFTWGYTFKKWHSAIFIIEKFTR